MSHRHPPFPAADHGAEQHPDDYFEEHHPGHPEPVEQFFEADLPSRRNRRPSKARQRQRRRRTIIMLIVVLGFVGVVVAAAMFLRNLIGVGEVTDYAGPGTGSVTFTVEAGAGALVVGNGLEQQDIVASSDEFLNAFAAVADGRVIQPGDYEMKYQMSSEEAAKALLADADSKVYYAAVARDLRQNEVFDVLAESTGIPREEFEALAEDPTQFGIPEQSPSLEGYLYPGEYRFDLDVTATEVIQQMVDNTKAALEDAGVTDPAEQYRILTIASIVQAEAGQADYAQVAGAILNRLGPDNTETNGLIQSDATVTYGLDRKSYNLTPEEKADTSNPYNTYANPGLPVGPIGSPSAEAIEAAVNPADVPYFYWVTVNLDTGETKFSETLAEHARYVQEYQEWCADNAGRCE
ncbi:endolytic transglycosylase MltG [uncultured Arthrobacter sp.]|uniref:endolytic transglycosylase MltG n=1 Tax=uncultured Arthrobacter sp. TaxID=114050 RepID=UPI00261473E7|nr:endolytic transglycosylase MltG [uncultured Arthrobacter sp.]